MVEGLDVNEVKDGLIVYDPASDRVHYLNSTAAVVFSLCDGTRDGATILEAVGAVFGAGGPSADELMSCIAKLDSEGLIQSEV